jgi:hypothetical protein
VRNAARRPRRSAVLVSFLAAVAALCALAYAAPQPARAAPAQAAAPAMAARGAQSPPIAEVCDWLGSKSLCANRNAGGTTTGTYVIAWSAGDPNNDFYFGWLTAMCGNGYVTVNPPCPFSNRGTLNQRYVGAPIAQIVNFDTGLCVAATNAYSGSTMLDLCNNPAGNGGAIGTIFVLPQVRDRINPNWPSYAVSRFWSNDVLGGNGTKPAWLCVIGKGSILTENSASGNAGTCEWNELHN